MADDEAKTFLSHGPGAAQLAMGESVTAIPNDVTAIYYNPAGLVYQEPAIHAEDTPVIDGGRYNFFGLNYPTGVGSFGFGIIQFAVDGIEGYQNLGDQPTSLSASQTAWFIPYSYGWKTFSLGTSLKIVDMNLAGTHGDGWGVDTGALYRKTLNDWTLFRKPTFSAGLSVKNLIQPSYTMVQDEETLPTDYKAGLAFTSDVFVKYSKKKSDLIYDSVTFSMDLDKTVGQTLIPSWGAEYSFHKLWALRMGYNGDISLGAGFGSKDKPIQFDYSFEMTGIGFLNRFSFEYRFSKGVWGSTPSDRRFVAFETSREDVGKYKERFLTRGREDLLDQRYGEALAEFENVSILEPDDPSVRELLEQSRKGYEETTVKKGVSSAHESMAAKDTNKSCEKVIDLIRQFPSDPQVQDVLVELKMFLKEQGTEAWGYFGTIVRQELTRIGESFEKAVRREDSARMDLLLSESVTLAPDDPLTIELQARSQGAKDEIVNSCLIKAKQEAKRRHVQDEYFFLWLANQTDPGSSKVKDEIGNFKEHDLKKTGSGAYDALYVDQLYSAAALHYVKGEYADCWKYLKELFEKDPLSENGNRLKQRLLSRDILITEAN